MKQFSKLVKNELVKIWKQVGLRIVLIIFVVYMIGMPLVNAAGCFFLSSLYSEDYSYLVEDAESSFEEGDYLNAAYCYGEYYSSAFFAERNLSQDSVEYTAYHSEIQKTWIGMLELEYASKGYITADVLQNDSSYISKFAVSLYKEYYPDESTYTWSSEKVSAVYQYAQEKLAGLQQEVVTFDIAEIYQTEYDDVEKEIAYYQQYLSSVSDGEYSQERFEVELMLEAAEAYAEGLKHLIDNKCPSDSWEYTTVMSGLSNIATSIYQYAPLSESEYDLNQESISGKLSYEDYVRVCNQYIESARAAIATANYSLKTETPIQGTTGELAKSNWQSYMISLVKGFTLFMVIIAVIIFTGEYSSGTVRLLLIRPRSRTKIFYSKLVALLAVGVVLFLFQYVYLFFANWILFGTTDIFMPDIFYSNGNIIVLSSFLSTFLMAIVAALSEMPYVLLAILLSVLVKKAALPIALPLLLHSVLPSVGSVVQMLYNGSGALRWLPFIYSDMTMFFATPMSSFLTQSYGSLLSLSSTMNYAMLSTLIPVLGAAYVLVIVAAEFLGSYFAFTKNDIKN